MGVRSVIDMTETRSEKHIHKNSVDARLVCGLAGLALLYPALGVAVHLLGGPEGGLASVNAWLWLAVATVWVLVVWLTRAARPLATLVLTGLVSGALTALVVGVIQFTASGSALLLTEPTAVVALVALHTVGGLVCGLIAWGLQSVSRTPRA